MNTSTRIKAAAALLLVFLCASNCSQQKKDEKQTASNSADPENSALDATYEITPDKTELSQLYDLDHLKEWYTERVLPPKFDYSIDLSDKSVTELWLLRNEIFARNGYLFDDAVLRGYFRQYSWYQPIFDVPDFKVQLSQEEASFIDKVLKLEKSKSESLYVNAGKHKLVNYDHVLNIVQFKENPPELVDKLKSQNFAIAEADNAQLFYVYDRNHYQYVPNFITTDLFLQVLHKHFSNLLQEIEEEKLIPLMTGLLQGLYAKALQLKPSGNPSLQNASQWVTTYLAIAAHLITNKDFTPPQGMEQHFLKEYYLEEVKKIETASGSGSRFLNHEFLPYSQFKPRGNYTKTPELEKYFRCIKWLNTAPVYIDSDEGMSKAVILATLINSSAQYQNSFKTFNDWITLIAGEEDNLSLANTLKLIPSGEDISKLVQPENLRSVRTDLLKNERDKIKPKAGSDIAKQQFAMPGVLFTAGRYSLDAEILSRLIHVLQPAPKRPFPKGLDVFAALGNKSAENILMETYNEPKAWPAYDDSLAVLKKQFQNYGSWEASVYTKTMDAIKALSNENEQYPGVMQTPTWKKKELITSLAAWTELKHDMILYSEQPYAAQAGEGGGPPPPLHISYVEPNVDFWKKSIALILFQERKITEMNMMTDRIFSLNKDLRELAEFLLGVSEKELRKENLTHEEFSELSWIGGKIEYLTYRILKTDHLPEREKYIALAADVYRYNEQVLQEAVGFADEIYVITEINGKPYLTRGSVFSYYEFPSDQVLTDEEWQAMLTSGDHADRPIWTKEITIKMKSLESKKEYSF